MAVVDKSATQNFSTSQVLSLTRALWGQGANIGAIRSDVAVASGDDDGSDYRLFTGLDARIRPLILGIGCTAITAGTDYDIEIWDTSGGAVIGADGLAAALDLHSAVALTPGAWLNGLAALANTDIGKMLYELAGHTTSNMRDKYDIVAAAETVGTADGTISALLIYALAQQP